MFGEVLRDTGVTGWLEDKGYKHSWLPGLALDVAFDPWTYAFGIGLAGRTLTTAPKVSQALKAAANTAKTAGRMDDHARLLAAAERVRKTKSISSAGKSFFVIFSFSSSVGLIPISFINFSTPFMSVILIPFDL